MARVNIHDLDTGIHIEVTAEKPEQVQPWLDWLRKVDRQSNDQPNPGTAAKQDEGWGG